MVNFGPINTNFDTMVYWIPHKLQQCMELFMVVLWLHCEFMGKKIDFQLSFLRK